MARIKPSPRARQRKREGEAAASQAAAPAKADCGSRHPLARRRALAAVVLAVVAVARARRPGHLAPRGAAGRRPRAVPAAGRRHHDFRLPEWIVGDVRGQVIETCRARGSAVDPRSRTFSATIENAFALHPWVESVERIEKQLSAGGARRAARTAGRWRWSRSPQGEARNCCRSTPAAFSLPADDVPLIRRSYLPRITGIVGQPPAGAAVGRPARRRRRRPGRAAGRRVGGAQPGEHRARRRGRRSKASSRYFVYDLVTRGGTRIVWGAAPQAALPARPTSP